MIQITHQRTQELVSEHCILAESFLMRLRGLIGRKEFRKGEGMMLNPCNDIHMWFMSIPIDVVFIKQVNESQYLVTSAHSSLKPWRVLPLRDSQATATLELPVGTIAEKQIKPGDIVCLNS